MSDDAGVGPGWYRDPTGQFQLRYWNGNSWTEHVHSESPLLTDSPSTPAQQQVPVSNTTAAHGQPSSTPQNHNPSPIHTGKAKPPRFAWRALRSWIMILSYTATCIAGSLGVWSLGGNTSSQLGLMNLLTLLVVIVCVATPRDERSVLRRLPFLVYFFLMHLLIQLILLIPVGTLLDQLGLLQAVDFSVALIAGVSVVVAAMRTSRLFVLARD